MSQLLGQLLVKDNAISNEELEHALQLQNKSSEYKGLKLGKILIELGCIEKYKLIKYLVIQGTYVKEANGDSPF